MRTRDTHQGARSGPRVVLGCMPALAHKLARHGVTRPHSRQGSQVQGVGKGREWVMISLVGPHSAHLSQPASTPCIIRACTSHTGHHTGPIMGASMGVSHVLLNHNPLHSMVLRALFGGPYHYRFID